MLLLTKLETNQRIEYDMYEADKGTPFFHFVSVFFDICYVWFLAQMVLSDLSSSFVVQSHTLFRIRFLSGDKCHLYKEVNFFSTWISLEFQRR